MDMIGFAIEICQCGVAITANRFKQRAQYTQGVCRKNSLAVFGDKDYMDMHVKDTMAGPVDLF